MKKSAKFRPKCIMGILMSVLVFVRNEDDDLRKNLAQKTVKIKSRRIFEQSL